MSENNKVDLYLTSAQKSKYVKKIAISNDCKTVYVKRREASFMRESRQKEIQRISEKSIKKQGYEIFEKRFSRRIWIIEKRDERRRERYCASDYRQNWRRFWNSRFD